MSNQTGPNYLTLEELGQYRSQGATPTKKRYFCPIHHGDNRLSLAVNLEKGSFKCHTCGRWGYVRELNPRNQAAFLGSAQGVSKSVTSAGTDRSELEPQLGALQRALTDDSDGGQYLKARGIPLEIALACGAGYAIHGEWPHLNDDQEPTRQTPLGRIVFPCRSPNGVLWNLYGRAVEFSGESVKGSDRHDFLPGPKAVFNVQAFNSKRVYLCEGVFDALSMMAAGINDVVAVFGKDRVPWEWVKSSEIVFCFDADAAAESWWDLAFAAATKFGKRVYRLPIKAFGGYKDLNETWLKTGKISVEQLTDPFVQRDPVSNETCQSNIGLAIRNTDDIDGMLSEVASNLAAIGRIRCAVSLSQSSGDVLPHRMRIATPNAGPYLLFLDRLKSCDLSPLSCFFSWNGVQIIVADAKPFLVTLHKLGVEPPNSLFGCDLANQVLGMSNDSLCDKPDLLEVQEHLSTRIAAEHLDKVHNIEQKCSAVISEIELAGIEVNVDALKTLSQTTNGAKAAEILRYVKAGTTRVHPIYHQLGADTGRMSVTSPAVQNVPRAKEYRRCFTAKSGCMLVIGDWSQIQLRIAAEFASEEKMIAAFREGRDLHTLTASWVFDKELNAVSEEERAIGKAINFQITFGAGPTRLKLTLQGIGVEISISQAEDYQARFFVAYPAIKAWHEEIGRNGGIATYSAAGRRRLWTDDDPPSLFQLLNTPVQGTEADILKLTLAPLSDALRPYHAKIVLVIHDEILVESPAEFADDVSALLKHEMENRGAWLLKEVPLVADVGTFVNWAKDRPVG